MAVDNAIIFEEITKELEAYLARESDDQYSTGGIFNFLLSISDSVQEEFDELISGDSDKKCFLWALSRIFALLLNTKVDTAEKIKRILKIAIEKTENMARTKATVRRLSVTTRQLPAWLVNREYGTQKRTIYPLKIQETLFEHYQEWTNHKNNKCKKKIQVFQRQE